MNMDVTKAIEAKSDQLNAADLLEPRTIKITNVTVKSGDQPISVFFEGDDGKPWKTSKTAARCLAMIWGPNASQWIGMSCTIYNDPTVQWGGANVGGIRVSHMEGIDKPVTLMLTKTRGKKGATIIQPLVLSDATEAQAVDEAAVLRDASDAARNGKDAFNAWWKANPTLRDIVKPIMEDLKKLVEESESNAQSS